MEDYESMTPSQLSQVALEMMKFTGLGSYVLRSDLFDLIEYLDRKVSISEDPNLEKYLHMTASLVCLTQFEGSINFDAIQPLRRARLKWFLFALYDLWTALGFMSVLDFFGDFVFLEHRRNGQTGTKTIFDHFRNAHARFLAPVHAYVSICFVFF